MGINMDSYSKKSAEFNSEPHRLMNTFFASGDLWTRLNKNYARLEESKYYPDNVYRRERNTASGRAIPRAARCSAGYYWLKRLIARRVI